MNTRRYLFALAVLGALAFLVSAPTLAAIPGTPENFSVTVKQNQNAVSYARLEWKRNANGGLPTYFYIYRATGAVTDYNLFSKIAKVAVVSRDSGITYPTDFAYDATGLHAGEHSFYLTAVNHDGASQPTQIITITIPASGKIYFTTSPPKVGYVGKELVYDADAKGDPGVVIKFQGVNLPTGATLDENNGVFKYTSSLEQLVTFAIKAYNASDPNVSAMQQIAIQFKNDSVINPPHPCAIISGTILDGSNAHVRAGAVKAIRVDSTGGAHYSGQLSAGQFKVYVAEGTYVIYAYGSDFTPEYYQDATSQQTATRITVKCTDSVHITMNVEQVQVKTISGTVIGEDNTPQMATIFFKSKDGSKKYTAVTNQSGAYTASLPANVEYIISATPKHNGFYPQYYNKVNDPALATLVLLDANKTGIDFVLTKKPSFNNGISGTVRDSAGSPLPSYVIAFFMQGQKPDNQFSYSVHTDSMGAYEFRSMQPGEYILYAKAFAREYVPGYHKHGDFVVPTWDVATRITVTDNGVVSGNDMKLHKKHGVRGKLKVHGIVSGKRLGVLPGGAEPIAGATVYLKDAAGRIVDYGISEVSGSYSIEEATDGRFTALTDRVGYTPASSSVELNSIDKSNIDLPVTMQPAGTTSIGDAPAASDFLLNVFPNPAAENITITMNRASGPITLRVFNALGVEVHATRIEAYQHGQNYSLNIHGYTAGRYFLIADGVHTSKAASFEVVK